MKFTQKLLSIILPQTCSACSQIIKSTQHLCETCDGQIRRVQDPCCTRCGLPFIAFSGPMHPCYHCLTDIPTYNWHRSTVLYRDPVNNLIHKFKYKAQTNLISLFSDWMVSSYGDCLSNVDYLIPVPLARRRLKKRSFNQSLELARLLSRQKGIALLVHSLQKIRETPTQMGLKRKERKKNLKGAFTWQDKKNVIKDKRVLLIDDVFTTGSTLDACAQVLRKQQPKWIGAMTVAYNQLS